LLEEGIYFPPSQFEVCFISAAHSREDIEQTLQAVEKALYISHLD
jgi:glutamate-1-semialdehyde 2,1-aminomutase